MFKKILFPFISLTLFAGCAKDSPQINAVCELKPNGTYLIKWETFPPMAGVVKAYESTNPDSFNRCSPIFEQDIQAGYQNVLAKAFTRSYLKLVFNKKYATVIAPRNIPMQGIFNFRDLGGYYTNDHQQMKWGKIYRSGSLSMATHYDRDLLKGLKITSVVDLRTERERDNYPNKYQATQVYNLPLRGNRHDFFFDEILSNRMNASDILVYDQNIFSFLMENNADYFIKLFDILLNEKNYPVVLSCFLGKDRAAIASALILLALGVNDDVILDDFLISNDLIDYRSLFWNADAYNYDIQEAITALYSAHKETLEGTLKAIELNYGSVDNYLEKELHLNHKKREKLKSILLY